MKRFITAIPTMLLLCCTVSVQAQTTNSKIQQHNAALIRAIENRQQARLAAKGATARTTGASERLIAESTSGSDGSIEDTTRYTYSSDRSSTFDFNYMQYNVFPQKVTEGFPIGIDFDFISYGAVTNTTGVFCDSSLTYAYTNNAWNIIVPWAGAYDNNNDLIGLTDSFSRTIITYDANQQPTIILYIDWNGTAWDTSTMCYITYSGNQVVSDSAVGYQNGTWSPLLLWSYSYDNNANLKQVEGFIYNVGGWVPQELYMLSYNANNLFIRDSIGMFPNGIWQPVQTDSLGYTEGVSYVTYSCQTTYDNATGVPEYRYIDVKHISAGLPDTFYLTAINMASNDTGYVQKLYYIYDSYGNPTSDCPYTMNPSTGNYNTTPDYYEHYYYQTFTTTDISNVAKQDVAIKVYPNPAANEINITMTGIAHGAFTYITLINALGQTVHTESLPWISTTQTISIAGLKPGNYWLMVQDKSGNVLGRQAVVKE